MTVRIILIGSLIQGILCLYKINLPANIEVLNGSCAFIPCTFEIDSSFYNNNTKRIWFNTGQKVFDSSSLSSAVLNGTIYGTPRGKNCSTLFYYVTKKDEGKYQFRLEQNKYRAYTFRQQLQMNITDSPPRPSVRLYNQQVEMVEETSVSLRCSAVILCSSIPPALVWSSSINDSIRGHQHRNQSRLISDLNFTVTHQHHNVNFTCVIFYQLQNRNTSARQSLTLHVQYAPKNTSVFVSPSGFVLEGRSVNLTCSSDGNPAVINYTWYRDTEGQLKHLQTGAKLIFNKTNPTHSGRYYCTAQNNHGVQNSSALLDIQYAPKNTSVFVSPSGFVLEGRSVNLTCSSDGNPAVINYTWYRDTEGQLKHLQTGAKLIFNKTNPTHSGRYYCTAQNKHGNQTSNKFILNVTYAPKISNWSCSRSNIITCFCEFRGNPVPSLQWLLSGRSVINSTRTSIIQQQLQDTDVMTTLTVRQTLKDTTSLQCVSENTFGTASHQFQLLHATLSLLYLLLGAALGMAVVMIFCIMSLICMRRQTCKPSQTKDNSSGLALNEEVVVLDNNTAESLHYCSVNFKKAEVMSGEIRGISSLTTDYTEIRHHAAGAKETRNISADVMDYKTDQSASDNHQPSEDTIYANITKAKLI